jgi:hypothetical protein
MNSVRESAPESIPNCAFEGPRLPFVSVIGASNAFPFHERACSVAAALAPCCQATTPRSPSAETVVNNGAVPVPLLPSVTGRNQRASS